MIKKLVLTFMFCLSLLPVSVSAAPVKECEELRGPQYTICVGIVKKNCLWADGYYMQDFCEAISGRGCSRWEQRPERNFKTCQAIVARDCGLALTPGDAHFCSVILRVL